jgi:carboxypeptidase C (cathepsin A)
MMKAAVISAALALTTRLASAAPADDEVLVLPGWTGPLPSKQYSGYLNIGPNGRKHMHYWLVESEGNPATDPIVLWLNGGPGCSSLDGMLYEHGPFRIDENDYTKLVRFNYTWATRATMVYLEAPVGVGFSYSDSSADYTTNDDITAADNLATLEALFAAFPEYKGNNLFLTGESYAGIYVPTLAEAVMNAEAAGTWTGAPLRGFAVGNGCTGSELGTCGHGAQSTYYETSFLLQHAFVPKSLKDQITVTCDFSGAMNNSNTPPLSAACDKLLATMHATVGNINIYNVYGECISGSAQQLEGAKVLKAPRLEPPKWAALGPNKGPNACIDSRAASAYLNTAEVIEAIHVIPQSFDWSVCGNQIHYSSNRPNLPRDTYPALIAKYRVLIYNGDWDACVPYTDNEDWTTKMGYPVAEPWHAWTYTSGSYSGQVGGYATNYATPNGFTFITVRGGRHEVPETQPERALSFFSSFIDGQDL